MVLLSMVNAFNICVVGPSSDLGKELVYQGIDRNIDILALTSSTQPFTKPCRINSFTEIKNQEPFYHPNIKKENYWNDLSRFNYDHLVLTHWPVVFELEVVTWSNPNNCDLIKRILN